MKRRNKASDKYIAVTKKYLKCSSKMRKSFLGVLIPEIQSFELSNPSAQYSDYIEEFGSPKDAAMEYLQELNDKEKRAYWLPRLGVVIAMIIIAFIFLIAVCISQVEDTPGYFVDSPVERILRTGTVS